MSDAEHNRESLEPPAPPVWSRAGAWTGRNVERWSDTELEEAEERGRRQDAVKPSWWKRLFRRQ